MIDDDDFFVATLAVLDVLSRRFSPSLNRSAGTDFIRTRLKQFSLKEKEDLPRSLGGMGFPVGKVAAVLLDKSFKERRLPVWRPLRRVWRQWFKLRLAWQCKLSHRSLSRACKS